MCKIYVNYKNGNMNTEDYVYVGDGYPITTNGSGAMIFRLEHPIELQGEEFSVVFEFFTNGKMYSYTKAVTRNEQIISGHTYTNDNLSNGWKLNEADMPIYAYTTTNPENSINPEPSTEPSTTPSTEPSTEPSTTPSTEPSTELVVDPSMTPNNNVSTTYKNGLSSYDDKSQDTETPSNNKPSNQVMPKNETQEGLTINSLKTGANHSITVLIIILVILVGVAITIMVILKKNKNCN